MTNDVRSIAKSERFELRMDESILNRIDEWRSNQKGIPTRAEAMRRLIETGLAQSSPSVIGFSSGERLILAMLGEIYTHLQIKGQIDSRLILEAIYGGHFWALNSQARGMPTHLFHTHRDKEEDVSFVVDVLDMWDFIENAYEKMPAKDRARVASAGNRFGTGKFPGFDSRHEADSELLRIAQFRIDKLGQFTRFVGRDLDSHAPMADIYRRMYSIFHPIRKTLLGTAPLSADQVIEVLNA